MLKKPSNYDDVQVNQEFERLELGGHKGIIKNVVEYTSTISGKTSLKVEVDTDKDDKQPNYYQKQYDENTNSDKKWSPAGTKYVPLGSEENQVKMLKSFITAIENSNNGFEYNWEKDVDQLKGKKVGLVAGIEEYTDSEGKTKTATKIVQFRSLDKVEGISIPRVKLLDGSFVEYEDYKSKKEEKNNAYAEYDTTVEIDDSFLD